MNWRPLVLAALCCAAAAGPALAQKTPPAITRDSDRDGVPDPRDRCRGTAAGTRVDASGCPAPAAAPAQPAAPAAPVAAAPATPTPALAGVPAPADTTRRVAPIAAAPAPPAVAPAAADTAAKPAGAAPAVTAPVPVTPQSVIPLPVPKLGGAAAPPAAPGVEAAGAVPPAAAAPPPAAAPGGPEVILADVEAPVLTGGFYMPPAAARTDSGRFEYLRIYVLRLDSAANALVETFRGTARPPAAQDPQGVSSRVRQRWDRCRGIYYDIVSFSEALEIVKDSLPSNPLLGRATNELIAAAQNTSGLDECDNVTSAIEEPGRWTPWNERYTASIQNFYGTWYTQLRAIHDANRSLARALNGMLPAARRMQPIAPLPPNPVG